MRARTYLRAAIVLLLVGLVSLALAGLVSAQTERVHIVRWGENLANIARQYGVSEEALAERNGLGSPTLLWVGEILIIPAPTPLPTAAATPTPTVAVPLPTAEAESPTDTPSDSEAAVPTAEAPPEPAADEPVYYTVQAGDILARIASRYGVTATAIARVNNLANANLIYVGQKLRIPTGEEANVPEQAANPVTPVLPAQGEGQTGKWIEVNLSTSYVTAWDGVIPVRSLLSSLGLPGTPTPAGRYAVYAKYVSAPMSGPGYYLPAVPHTMYFYRGYALHGAYWHNNFGHPMSHGCVNLSLPDAQWLFNWTPMGTPVIIHW